MSADLYPSNLPYVEELYRLWLSNPAAVPPDWREYFEGLNRGAGAAAPTPATSAPVQATSMAAALHVYKQSRVNELIWAYRDIGYLQADLNPLRGYVTPGMAKLRDSVGGDYRELSLNEFDLNEDDLDLEFSAGKYLTPSRGPLRQIVEGVRETYCGAMGVEILHIQNRAMREWLIENIETGNNRPQLESAERRAILEDVIKAEEFERFLHSQFVGQKRFSLEGSESLIPALHALIDRSAYAAQVEEIVLGMTHRGRLNVLVNLLGRTPASIFSTFKEEEMPAEESETGSGDVRYHLGFSVDHVLPDGSRVHVGLVANPSHLEAVDAVVEGKARGVQRRRQDKERKKVIPVLLHGDSAFTGQGVVAETFNMSQLKGYRTGGTIHIIVNNQIGFTTASRDARSTFFPTDVAKSMPVPVIHVNGDKPEYVVRAMDIAFRFRQQFAYDAVVDIFCYRKYGHNEADDPTFTHPVMYETIRQLPSVATQYGEELDREGVYPKAGQDAFREGYRNDLRTALTAASKPAAKRKDAAFQSDEWRGFSREYDHTPVKTGLPETKLDALAKAVTHIPDDIPVNPRLKRIIDERRQRFTDRTNIDWSSAESLAFASLLAEGTPIRLSGEDSARGTFSQRHAVWWYTDQDVPKPWCPFDHLAKKQAAFTVYDSPLSEYSVLGFEYGNSVAQPHMLTIWEAQFGDFANGAQVVIDQFIAAGQSKWERSSGLVMLLPHGYSGQGPEHSSAHMERYLQLCAEDNIQVCNMTTPAQYFHVLRRQMHRKFRKPLVIMAPKSLLRHKRCVSHLADFATGSFNEVLDDTVDMPHAEVLLLCSGQVYYDLLQARETKQTDGTAIIRMEQLYPFPRQQLEAVLTKYKQARAFVWVQEESRNRGAWTFMREHINGSLGGNELRYVGRKASASPATGSFSQHQKELQTLLDEAFSMMGQKVAS